MSREVMLRAAEASQSLARTMLSSGIVIATGGLALLLAGIVVGLTDHHAGGLTAGLIFFGILTMISSISLFVQFSESSKKAASLLRRAAEPDWADLAQAELGAYGHVFRYPGAPCTCKGRNWVEQIKCLACSPWE